MNTLTVSCVIAVLVCVLKVVYSVWVRPKRLEKYLREQGFNGNKYKVFYGDMKEFAMIMEKEKSRHIKLNGGDDVLRYVMPYYHHVVKKYGKSFIIWFGWKPRVHVLDPELIKEVLKNSNDYSKEERLNPLAKLIVEGLVSYDGDQWTKHRRLLNPAFHVEKLKNMFPAFQLSCSKTLEKWETVVSSKGSCELDVWTDVQALSCDAIARTSFGSSYEEGLHIFELLNEQVELVVSTFESIYIPGMRFLPTKKNKRMKAIDKEIRQMLTSIIDTRLKAMKAGEGKSTDLLGLMLASNIKEVEDHGNKSYGMTINEIIDECKLFYVAGQETTASLLVWTMILLSEHQEWQSRAREEVLNVFGKRNLDSDGLNQLKILTMIINEVMRLYPPALGVARRAKKDIRVGGSTLPSGTEIGIPIMLVHYDEELWGTDAKEFNPERFSEGVSKATKNQVTYIPFGWGPRICIGQNFALMEAKIALAMILRRFSFEVSPSYVHAPRLLLTIQPEYGAHLILHKL